MLSKSHNHQIRHYDSDKHDDADIAAIHLDVRKWQVANQNNVFSDILDSQPDLSAIQAAYVKPGGNFFIAQDPITNDISGFVAIRNDGDGVGKLKRLAVVPKYQRRGIATTLVGIAVEWASDNGFTKLKLSTGMRENARPIYEQFGFRVVGRKPNNDYRMELQLK